MKALIPVVLLAALRGIPTMLMEQNATPGLTNRLLARVVTAAAAHEVLAQVGHDPNLTYLPLAEAQPGVPAVSAAAQVATVLAGKIGALLLGPGLAHAPGIDDFVAAVLRNARATPTIGLALGSNATIGSTV